MDSHHQIRKCQFARYWPPPLFPRHYSDRLVCQGCRDIQHFEPFSGGGAPPTYPGWRLLIARAKVSVCRLCDREQRAEAGDEGFDGCTCYADLYQSRWLCHSCDDHNQNNAFRQGVVFKARVCSLQIVANRMTIARRPLVPPHERPICPCGRAKVLIDSTFNPPLHFANAHFRDFPGHHNLETYVHGNFRLPPRKLQGTKQCFFCLGYIVPPRRRSARLRNRRLEEHGLQEHHMLDDRSRPIRVSTRLSGPQRRR